MVFQILSNTAETGVTRGLPIQTFRASRKKVEMALETIFSSQKGYKLVHKSEAYGEYLYHHKNGDINISIVQNTVSETAVSIHVITKMRFGFPRKYILQIYRQIEQSV